MNKSNSHGGKRPKSGAKPKYGEITKVVSFRIPVSLIPAIKKIVYSEINRIKNESKRI